MSSLKKKKTTHNACKETQIHGPFKEVKKSTEIVLETDLTTNQLNKDIKTITLKMLKVKKMM